MTFIVSCMYFFGSTPDKRLFYSHCTFFVLIYLNNLLWLKKKKKVIGIDIENGLISMV